MEGVRALLERRGHFVVPLPGMAVTRADEVRAAVPALLGDPAHVRALTTFADHRAPDGTTCPSDAARAVGGATWRDRLDEVRDVVRELAADGRVEVTQGGEPIDAAAHWHGPVRVRSTAGGEPT